MRKNIFNTKYVYAILFFIYIFTSLIYVKNVKLSYDEPHYVLSTVSIIQDFDFDLKNNYINKDYKDFYNGELDPHISPNSVGDHWYSIHGYGLPILLIPFIFLGKLTGNVLLGIHFFNIAIYMLSFMLFRRILLINEERESNHFLLFCFFTTLPILVYTKFLAVENIAFLYISYVLYLYSQFKKTNKIDLTFFIIASIYLPFVHVKFILFSMFSVLLLFILMLEIKYKKIVYYIFFYLLGLILLIYMNNTMYGSYSISAAYKGDVISFNYFIQGVLGQFFDSQIGLFNNNPIYILSIFVGIGILTQYKRFKTIDKIFYLYIFMIVGSVVFLASTHIIRLESIQDFNYNHNLANSLNSLFTDKDTIPMWFQVPLARFLVPILPVFIFIAFQMELLQKIRWLLYTYAFLLTTIVLIIPEGLYRPNADFEALNPVFEYIHKFFIIDLNLLFPNLLSFQYTVLNIVQGILLVCLLVFFALSYSYKTIFFKNIIIVIFMLYSVSIYLKYDAMKDFQRVYIPKQFFLNEDVKLNNSNYAIYNSLIRKSITFSYGPYVYLPYGKYLILFDVDYNMDENSSIVFDWNSVHGDHKYKEIIVNQHGSKMQKISFIAENEHPESVNEFRIFLQNYKGSFILKNVKLTKLNKVIN